MAKRKITNCGECAYVDKTEEQAWWCPFHDEPVSSSAVCDDFLEEFESPQWRNLIDGINENAKAVPQYLGGDIVAYGLTALLAVMAVLWIVLDFI